MEAKKTGVTLIAEERKRQMDVHGYDSKHDSQYQDGSIADMAAIYACSHRNTEIDGRLTIRSAIWGAMPTYPFDWVRSDRDWFTDQPDRITELVKAGALIAAEIDRLQNQQP